jgi:glucose-6-phosphate 1-dehydrogenase
VVGHNQLIFNIQPEEGITLKFQVKVPNTDDLETADLKFKYKDVFQTMLPEAYEKILFDIVTRTDAFDITGEELDACWKLIDPILQSWQQNDDLKFYPAGSNELL